MRNKVLSFYGINRTQKGDYYKITLVEDREDGTKNWYVAFVKKDQVQEKDTDARAVVTLSLKKLEFKEKEPTADPLDKIEIPDEDLPF